MKTTGKSKIDTVFVLVIFSVFALSVLLVLMFSAGVYKSVTDLAREHEEERTLLSYIWTKVKNNDKDGSIRVIDFHGINALCFDEYFEGENFELVQYSTVIYQYEGWVCELFYETELNLAPEDGVQIMRIGSMTFEDYDNAEGMIKVSAGSKSQLLYPRSVWLEATGEIDEFFFFE